MLILTITGDNVRLCLHVHSRSHVVTWLIPDTFRSELHTLSIYCEKRFENHWINNSLHVVFYIFSACGFLYFQTTLNMALLLFVTQWFWNLLEKTGWVVSKTLMNPQFTEPSCDATASSLIIKLHIISKSQLIVGLEAHHMRQQQTGESSNNIILHSQQ